MSKAFTFACLVLAAQYTFAAMAAAQPSTTVSITKNAPPPPTISVVASGTMEYVPDIARITVGIRAEAPTAASAADMVNKNAAQVIAAVQALGINPKSMKTSGYNLEYREPPPPPAVPGATLQSPGESVAHKALPPAGKYVASEILQVAAPVKLAGGVLDAAIGTGANEAFGVSYQSSDADSLYRSALARAVQSARDTAHAIASAAHVSIIGIESISNAPPRRAGFGPEPFAARAAAQAAVLPGTDVVTATVFVVFRIRQ